MKTHTARTYAATVMREAVDPASYDHSATEEMLLLLDKSWSEQIRDVESARETFRQNRLLAELSGIRAAIERLADAFSKGDAPRE